MTITLPVTKHRVTLRRPGGEEDILLFEAARRDMRLAVALLTRIGHIEGDAPLTWEELPVTDIEAVLLELRRMLFGDLLVGEAVCPACGSKVDIAFSISEYLRHHAPRVARDAEVDEQRVWFSVRSSPVKFRLPNAADQIAAEAAPQPERELIARCVRPAELPPRLLARAANAMEALAPPLTDMVEGTCPECSTSIEVYFDAREFTLRELRDEASLVFEEVHLLASRYHWSEAEIMRMPRSRRLKYTDLIEREGQV